VKDASGAPVTMVINTTASQVQYGHHASLPSRANGDRYQCNMLLEAGTYDFSVYYVKSPYSAIMDLYVDGVAVATGLDTYHASTNTYDNLTVYTGISVPTTNYHLVEWVVNGRNAGASDYRALVTYIGAQQVKY
jgi:hypothetical protein